MFIDNTAVLAPLISGVAIGIVAAVTAIHSWRLLSSRVFSIFSFVLAAWSLGSSYMFYHCSEPSYVVFIDRVIYIFVSAIPAIIFHFSLIYSKKSKPFAVFSGYGIMVLFWGIVWTPYFLNGLNTFSVGCHSRAAILHHPFLIYFVGFTIATLYNVYNLYRNTEYGKDKRQYQFVFFALAIQSIIGTSAFLPAYGINTIPFSYYSGLITTLILVFAIFRHNILELKSVAINIFIALVGAALLFQIFFVESFASKVVNAIIFVFIIGLGVLVVKNVKEEVESREKGEKLARYLANANARLRELDKQKTEFVSIASHQLRSPIAAIKGYTSLITEGSYGEVPKYLGDPLNRILESGQRIGIMVDDFLNVTRIEQGRMSYDMQKHNVCELVNDVVEELQVVAEEKELKLTTECDPVKEMCIGADEGKIKQIFSNLIDNAIKYTQEGSIHVSVKQIEPEHKVIIKIKDTGIGIDPEEVQNLFQKFNRASNANKTNVLGTGLGLYIAKEILKAHNGWVGVESEGIGKGSTFTVELPVYDERNYKLDKKEK